MSVFKRRKQEDRGGAAIDDGPSDGGRDLDSDAVADGGGPVEGAEEAEVTVQPRSAVEAVPSTVDAPSMVGDRDAVSQDSGPEDDRDGDAVVEPAMSDRELEVEPVGVDDLDVEEEVDPQAELRSAIEAICMVSDQPVPATLLAEVLDVSTAKIDELCAELAQGYADQGRGFVLANVAGGWRFQSHPDRAPQVERFVLDGQTGRLSGAALETLAIVAYKQPLSRAQIAAIRGVNVDGVLKTLQQRGYVTEMGHDSGPGQAMLFGTTTLFLEKIGIASLADLPPLGDFFPDADLVEALEQGLRPTPAVNALDDDEADATAELAATEPIIDLTDDAPDDLSSEPDQSAEVVEAPAPQSFPLPAETVDGRLDGRS